MNNTIRVHLMWVPGQNASWAVYLYGCPDTGNLPTEIYRTYEIPYKDREKVFRRLIKIKEKLDTDNIIPSRDNQNIFPELTDLLE